MTIKFMSADFFFSSKDKSKFFDRQNVIDKLGKGKARALGMAGAVCRKTIQKGMRRATSDKPSKPGKPPKQRLTGDDGLRKITYNLIEQEDTVRVAVVKWSYRKDSPYNQPALHEFGGTVPVTLGILGPTRETKWMFDPLKTKKFKRIEKTIRKWNLRRNKKGLKINGTKGRVYTVQDFTVTETRISAKYPKRSFMESGAEKYMRSKHFQARVAELLRY